MLAQTARSGMLVALLAVGAAARPAHAETRQATPPTTTASRPDPVPATRPILGFALNAHHISNLDLYLTSVDRIAETGANALILVTPMFQEHIDSTEIRYLPGRCPTDAQLLAILERGHSRGLQTTLLPIVLIEAPRHKEWRGLIAPTDWDAWWASYQRFISRFVALAKAAEVDMLVVGSELNSTEDQIDRWQHVIARTRARYRGRLSYAANWDRYDHVKLWPLVDIMSVSAYFELSPNDEDAPLETLTARWADERDKMLKFAARWKRPLLLTEVGYPSLPWAAAHPWNYVPGAATQADHEAQARCYRAFFETWSRTVSDPASPALGFYCYYWDPYHNGGPADTGYGVAGKPALAIIRSAFAGIGQAPDDD